MIKYILVEPIATKPKKPTTFDAIISWVTQNNPFRSQFDNSLKEMERKINLELSEILEKEQKGTKLNQIESDIKDRLSHPVALIADCSDSGYCLAYGFVAITKKDTNTEYQYFQYAKPRRFENSAWEGFSCMNQTKSGESVEGSYVSTLNMNASEADYLNDFFALHNEFFHRDKGLMFGLFSSFRTTEINPEMSLTEIVSHAEKKPNRSREVLVHMGLMTKDGKKTEKLENCLPTSINQSNP